MAEKFTYSSQSKIVTRRSLSKGQAFLLSSLWILVAIVSISGIILQQEGKIPQSLLFTLLITIGPVLVAFALAIYIALHPRGPMKEFEWPSVEMDKADLAQINGKVILKSGEKIDVEVTVPKVYSSSTPLFGDNNLPSSDGSFAIEEMFEIALETINEKYQNSRWENVNELKIIEE